MTLKGHFDPSLVTCMDSGVEGVLIINAGHNVPLVLSVLV